MSTNAEAAPTSIHRLSTPFSRTGNESGRRVLWLPSDVLRELPDERLIRIDINGCHAGTISAIPDALEELALGWALMYGFLGPCDQPDRVTVDGDRVSIMVANGEDIDRRRLAAVGWVEGEPLPLPGPAGADALSMTGEELIALIDACWTSFRHDDGGDGYHQAAVATATSVLCIARDRSVDYAVAKVLGWLLREDRETGAALVLVRGMIGRRVVEAATRMGLAMLVTSGLPTAEACRAAQGAGMTVVGMATARTVGVLIDHGHLKSG